MLEVKEFTLLLMETAVTAVACINATGRKLIPSMFCTMGNTGRRS
jgi:hypothetical protein